MRKKRILMVGESSWLNTGYSTYGKEILSRLYATNKYEIAELGCFAHSNDPQQGNISWKFYGNLPNPSDPEETSTYNSNAMNAFGAWKLEETLLDFKCDILVDARDPYMCEFELTSPFRPYYHLAWMPTVDSVPQHPQWLSMFMNVDGVFTYSDWGLRVLNESKGLIKTVGTASPGVDLDVFKPVKDKKVHKQSLGFPADSFVIGTVMRNQKRKLFPDLMRAFRMFLDQAPQEIAQRSYLYMHTSYPDYFDIPGLMLENGVSGRCLFTYVCKACKYVFVSHFQDARGICGRCHSGQAFLPNTHLGVDRKELSQIYNLFDVYVQYSSCEGFGVPIIEASSCGLPILAVDYSAMYDLVRKLRGYPIKVLKMVRDGELGADRAIPDNQDLVDQLLKFIELPEGWKNKKSFDTRKATEKYFNWNSAAKAWENYFDSLSVPDHSLTWNSPIKQHEVPRDVPANLSPSDLISWAIATVAGKPELLNSYMAMRLLRDIQWGSTIEKTSDISFSDMSMLGLKPKRKNFSKEDALQELKKIADNANYWEMQRWLKVKK